MINLYRMRGLIRDTVKLQWRIEREQAKATKITTTLTGMPRASGNHSKVEDGAIRMADLTDHWIVRMTERLCVSDISKGSARRILQMLSTERTDLSTTILAALRMNWSESIRIK